MLPHILLFSFSKEAIHLPVASLVFPIFNPLFPQLPLAATSHLFEKEARSLKAIGTDLSVFIFLSL